MYALFSPPFIFFSIFSLYVSFSLWRFSYQEIDFEVFILGLVDQGVLVCFSLYFLFCLRFFQSESWTLREGTCVVFCFFLQIFLHFSFLFFACILCNMNGAPMFCFLWWWIVGIWRTSFMIFCLDLGVGRGNAENGLRKGSGKTRKMFCCQFSFFIFNACLWIFEDRAHSNCFLWWSLCLKLVLWISVN